VYRRSISTTAKFSENVAFAYIPGCRILGQGVGGFHTEEWERRLTTQVVLHTEHARSWHQTWWWNRSLDNVRNRTMNK